MPYQNLLIEDTGSARVLILNRPEKRNALSLELMLELIDALGDAESDSAVRAIIVAAAGTVFSAGHDLSELADRDEAEYSSLFDVCTDLMLKLQSVPQPVIAEVQGLATAAGCQLAAGCDLVVASETAAFATPGVKIGLFCTTPGVPLVRAIGRKRAMEMLLTGRPIDARTAEQWGLVNRVVPREELRKTALELAGLVAQASAYTIAAGKRAFYDQVGREERSAYARAKHAMVENALAEDAQEGVSAFLDKRAPVWRGR